MDTIQQELLYPPIHQQEWFVFLAAKWDVTKAWNLITAAHETGDVSVADIYKYYLSDTDVDWNDDSNWEDLGGGRRQLKKGLCIFGIHIDKNKALSDDTKTDVPLIGVVVRDDKGKPIQTLIIDGYHRAYKAYKQGIETLPMVILSETEERLIRIR